MKIIDNKELLIKYLNKYEIDKLFSFWNKYETKLVKYDKGEIICSNDKKLNEITFIVKGCIKIYYISSEGKALYLSFKKAFSMIGDMEFAGEEDAPYAEAISDVLTVSISLDKYRDLLYEDILFCRYVIKCLAHKINLSSKNSFLNRLHSKESRLALYILTNEENNFINENWTDVSNLLSISYRQLMRLLSKFCEKDIIKRSCKKGVYEITNIKELEYLCKDVIQ